MNQQTKTAPQEPPKFGPLRERGMTIITDEAGNVVHIRHIDEVILLNEQEPQPKKIAELYPREMVSYLLRSELKFEWKHAETLLNSHTDWVKVVRAICCQARRAKAGKIRDPIPFFSRLMNAPIDTIMDCRIEILEDLLRRMSSHLDQHIKEGALMTAADLAAGQRIRAAIKRLINSLIEPQTKGGGST